VLSARVRVLLRQRKEDKKHDPFAGIIQIKLLPYNLSRSGAVETSKSLDYYQMLDSNRIGTGSCIQIVT
jgi:archaellum component FlaD/FlaE